MKDRAIIYNTWVGFTLFGLLILADKICEAHISDPFWGRIIAVGIALLLMLSAPIWIRFGKLSDQIPMLVLTILASVFLVTSNLSYIKDIPAYAMHHVVTVKGEVTGFQAPGFDSEDETGADPNLIKQLGTEYAFIGGKCVLFHDGHILDPKKDLHKTYEVTYLPHSGYVLSAKPIP